MKNLIIILSILLGLGTYAQDTNDGYARPVLGAHWNDGLRGAISKYIHYNIHQDGTYDIPVNGKVYSVEVKILTDQLILFKEYANYNRNWVSAPGGKLWKRIDRSQLYLAECANEVGKIRAQKTRVETRVAYKEVDLSPLKEELALIKEGQLALAGNQRDLNTCQQVRMEAKMIQDNYLSSNMLIGKKRFQKKLDQLKSENPSCLPEDLTLERTHKFWGWFEENAPEIAFGVINTVQLEQIKNRKITFRHVRNLIGGNGPGHDPNIIGGSGHNSNGIKSSHRPRGGVANDFDRAYSSAQSGYLRALMGN